MKGDTSKQTSETNEKKDQTGQWFMRLLLTAECIYIYVSLTWDLKYHIFSIIIAHKY